MMKLTQEQTNTLVRHARERADTLASRKTSLLPVLEAPMALALDGEDQAVLENVDIGIKRLLDRRGRCHMTPASRWLSAALMQVADEFADRFASDVLTECEELQHETREPVAQGGE